MLELYEIKKSFAEPGGGVLDILDIEEFVVGEAEEVVLIGESGCGKTTLLHIIAGISRPNSGEVRLDGIVTNVLTEAECDRYRAEKIGYVFQTFNLLPAFTALENVLLAMRFAGRHPDRQRALALLDRVGLSQRTTHRPPMLSVGEQQRVALARALANSPRLILADEPTANVDTGNQQQVINLLREATREEGAALVMVTHSQQVAEQFDRVEHLMEINKVAKKFSTT